MGSDDQDKAEVHDRDHVGIVAGAGAAAYGIDAKHLDVGAGQPGEGKAHHDHSWRSKAEEEEPDDSEESVEA